MRAAVGFLRATLVGGVMFLLPVGVVLVVAGKLYAIARGGAQAVHDALFPQMASQVIPFLLALIVLLGIALAAGLFARTRTGLRVFSTLEELILSRLPVYTLLKQTLADMAGGASRLAGDREVKVVAVRLDDQRVLGFLVDRAPDGDMVVFLPGAPSAFTGSVSIVTPDRVTETALTPQDVLGAMRRLGAGLQTLDERRG